MRHDKAFSVQGRCILLLVMLATGAITAQNKPSTRATPTDADVRQMLSVQVALDRTGFSPGEIDGQGGLKTQRALAAFQAASGLQPTGEVDEETVTALRHAAAPKDIPHLHFGIAKLDPDRHWWGGTPLDPFLVWRVRQDN